MSSQRSKLQPFSHCTQEYLSAAVNTITRIDKLKKQIERLHSETSNRQIQAERMRRAKIKLEENKSLLHQMCSDTVLNPILMPVFQMSKEQNRDNTQSIKEKILIEPRFDLPDIDWVTNFLDQITEESFASLSEQLRKEEKNIETLETMQVKYLSKLRTLEEKLAKGYSEARSKKRFL